MLYTNLKHIETTSDFNHAISTNENVFVVCGNMNSLSISLYRFAEELEKLMNQVKFFDAEFENPNISVVRNITGKMEVLSPPYCILIKNGKADKIFENHVTVNEIKSVLENEFLVEIKS